MEQPTSQPVCTFWKVHPGSGVEGGAEVRRDSRGGRQEVRRLGLTWGCGEETKDVTGVSQGRGVTRVGGRGVRAAGSGERLCAGRWVTQ